MKRGRHTSYSQHGICRMKDTENQIGQNYSEEQLLKLLSRQRESALKELYNRYWETLYINAWKVLGDEKACEDVVQEVFIDLWEKGKFSQIENLSAYLYKAVKYKTLMTLRKNRITEKHLAVLKEISPVQTIDRDLQVRELREEITYHLAQLPPRCREVFYKSRFEHLRNEEIAEQLNISKRTVETHISHALRYLRGVKELLMIIIWLGFF